jgi:hypothetical protein
MKYIWIIARKYRGQSIYVNASNPGYEYIVAIPNQLRFPLAPEFAKELYAHRPTGEDYFVFECGNGDVPMVADTFKVAPKYAQGGWYHGDLVLNDNGNLYLQFAWSE